MGYNLDVDHQPSEEVRIVQMTPFRSGCSVTIGEGLARMEPGSLREDMLNRGSPSAPSSTTLGRGS